MSETITSGSAPRIALQKLCVQGWFKNVNLEIRPGEIVALVGQLGSGADLLVETLAGLQKRYEGEILVDGDQARLGSIRQAMDRGIAYVPEDRAAKGVFLETSIRRNLTASILKGISRAGIIIHRRESGRVQELAQRFEIDPRRLPDNVSQLSGGNQQKVALGRAAATHPKLLLLNEPTRGIDVGARSEIYRRLKDLAKQGLTIIFYSTDLEEVGQLADRVVNFFRGNIVTSKPASRTSAREILYEILHGKEIPANDQGEDKHVSS